MRLINSVSSVICALILLNINSIHGKEQDEINSPVVSDLQTNKQINLEKFKGKVLVLHFFAMHQPVKKHIKILGGIYKRYRNNKVMVISICLDDKPGIEVLKFGDQKEMEWPLYGDPRKKLYKAMKLKSLPVIVIADKKGKIKHRFALKSIGTLENMLKEIVLLLEN